MAKQTNQTNETGSTIIILAIVLMGAIVGVVGWQVYRHHQADRKAQAAQQQLDAAAKKLQEAEMAKRDNQRKADMAIFMSAVQQFGTDHNGNYPSTDGKDTFFDEYVTKKNADFKDPKEHDFYLYVPVAKVQSPPPLKVGSFQYQWMGRCEYGKIVDSTSIREVAVATLLENGDSYCLD